MANSGDIEANKFCGIVFGKGCGDWEIVNDWSVAVPAGKPPTVTPQLPQVSTM